MFNQPAVRAVLFSLSLAEKLENPTKPRLIAVIGEGMIALASFIVLKRLCLAPNF